MVIERGQIWWADLPEPHGSSPGYEHPIVVVQSDYFNQTKLNTIIGAVITSNVDLAEMPGNVLIKKNQAELSKDSVVNVTQLVTVDKSELLEYVGMLSERKMEQIENGLRLVLSL
ncbi:MAG TPA: type II toxin-antitoxin system PemK/MazF family toxin [Pyrinomonadaceae bacterium]|nr:type II toxin-antitoxin system PemK/MazF family toxin [Pyrinomonadaceae bacterium]